MCSSRVESSFHSPSISHTGFQPGRGFLFPVRPQSQCTQYVTQTTDSPERVSIHVISLFLWIPSQGHRSWPDHFSYLQTEFHMDLSYSFHCTGIFLPVSSCFQLFTCIMYFWCVGGMRCVPVLLLYHLDLPSLLLLFWRRFSESFILKFYWPYRKFFLCRILSYLLLGFGLIPALWLNITLSLPIYFKQL